MARRSITELSLPIEYSITGFSALGHGLAQDVDALGFEALQVGQLPQWGPHGSHQRSGITLWRSAIVGLCECMPPSTSRVWPLMNPASSLARNSAA